MFLKFKDIGEKLRRAYDPFNNQRFITFRGKLKDVPKKVLEEALAKGWIQSSDSPEMEVKYIQRFNI